MDTTFKNKVVDEEEKSRWRRNRDQKEYKKKTKRSFSSGKEMRELKENAAGCLVKQDGLRTREVTTSEITEKKKKSQVKIKERQLKANGTKE